MLLAFLSRVSPRSKLSPKLPVIAMLCSALDSVWIRWLIPQAITLGTGLVLTLPLTQMEIQTSRLRSMVMLFFGRNKSEEESAPDGFTNAR